MHIREITHIIIVRIIRKFKIETKRKGEIYLKQLVNSTRKKAGENVRTAVLRLEMDYELATLFDAMTEQNENKKKDCKQKLEKIRLELVKLKAL